MEININPSDIDKYVKDAILESTLGKDIKSGIEKSLSELFSGYRNPIEQIMKSELERIVKDYLDEPNVKDTVMRAIARVLTSESVEAIITYGVSRLKEYNSN